MPSVITHSIHLNPYFFFNDTTTTEIYTLSLHDALPIYRGRHGLGPCHSRAQRARRRSARVGRRRGLRQRVPGPRRGERSEEHTSELQSHSDLVCRLLLEKKKKNLHIILTVIIIQLHSFP